tara:strand:+ start:3254 stop:4363 length:1110 start_codon:yes stop_codon:yes gene_type:complete
LRSSILKVIPLVLGLLPITAHSAELKLTPEQAANISLKTTQVMQRKVSQVLSLNGRVVENRRRSFSVGPIVDGIVKSVEAVSHDKVRKGQVLVRIRSNTLGQAQADYLDALSKFELTQAERKRIKALRRDRIVSESRWLEADSNHKRAGSALDQRRRLLSLVGLSESQISTLKDRPDQLAAFELLSPIDGLVIESKVESGQALSAGETAFRIIDLSSLWVEVGIPVANLKGVRLKAIANVSVEARPGQAFQGHLESLSGSVDERSQTVGGRVVVQNPEGLLRPGMYARIELEGVPHEGLAIPASAVFRLGDQSHVFKVLGPRRFEPVAVKIGEETGGWVPLLAGLDKGMEVLHSGVAELKGHWQYQGGN